MLRPGALGDTLVAVPALRALRRACSPITLAAHAGTARLLESLGEVDRGLAFDDPSLAWVLQGGETSESIVAWMSNAVPATKVREEIRPGRRGRGAEDEGEGVQEDTTTQPHAALQIRRRTGTTMFDTGKARLRK